MTNAGPSETDTTAKAYLMAQRAFDDVWRRTTTLNGEVSELQVILLEIQNRMFPEASRGSDQESEEAIRETDRVISRLDEEIPKAHHAIDALLARLRAADAAG
jgi:hypothetical protein